MPIDIFFRGVCSTTNQIVSAVGRPGILFIDADQIVRADVRELWEIDIEG